MKILIYFTFLVLVSCHSSPQPNDFEKKVTLHLDKGNILYSFPEEVGMIHINSAIQQTELSIKENLKLLKEESFLDTIQIEFVRNRQEMIKYTGRNVSGLAIANRNTMFSLIGKGYYPPIKHELMHLISMLKWGIPSSSNYWLNEGLATYAAGTCTPYSLEEIYTYFLQTNQLIGIKNLAIDFYQTNELLAYPQAAYICKVLIKKFGIKKFKSLWQKGTESFEEVYGLSPDEFEKSMASELRSKHKTKIDFDWNKYSKGCN